MSRQTIHTERAPQAIGTYSQAVRVDDTVYLSGQVPLDPASMQLVSGDIEAQIRRRPAEWVWWHERWRKRPRAAHVRRVASPSGTPALS